jgi:hypothetical protein
MRLYQESRMIVKRTLRQRSLISHLSHNMRHVPAQNSVDSFGSFALARRSLKLASPLVLLLEQGDGLHGAWSTVVGVRTPLQQSLREQSACANGLYKGTLATWRRLLGYVG